MDAPAKPAHHRSGGGFRNPWLQPRDRGHGLIDELKCRLRLGAEADTNKPQLDIPAYRPDVRRPELEQLRRPAGPDTFRVTWIGHSTFLIQHNGVTMLTDPVFADRASPVSFAGPKRRVPPAVAAADLPPIDVVLVSHNHYDHLDRNLVRLLGDNSLYCVPLGLRPWFAKQGINNVREYDWWDSAAVLGAFDVHAVPAQHFSARGLSDRNDTLWCGWVIDGPQGRFYFAGDTGYGPFFKEIGRRLGPFAGAIIPIGAYQPRWFMRAVHCDPAEAVQVHRDVGSRLSVASHWGTFKLTTEPMAEPPIYLDAAKQASGLEADAFVTLAFGETKEIPAVG